MLAWLGLQMCLGRIYVSGVHGVHGVYDVCQEGVVKVHGVHELHVGCHGAD